MHSHKRPGFGLAVAAPLRECVLPPPRTTRQAPSWRKCLRRLAHFTMAATKPDPVSVPGIPVPSKPTQVSVDLGRGKSVTFETGRVARQAHGSVIVRLGGTLVFCTACAEASAEPGTDFLPLRVDYAEKFSSVGRTSGSYIKREGRPSERETLCSRLIDRPLRPMFADRYYNGVQLLANVLSYDGIHAGDPLAICGCAAALHISKIPLVKAVAGVRIARVGDEFIVNPTVEESKQSKTELVVAGTRDAVLMIEGICDFLTEEQVLEAVSTAQDAIAKLCDGLDKLRNLVGVAKTPVEESLLPVHFLERIEELATGLDEAIAVVEKKPREVAMEQVRAKVWAELLPILEEEAASPRDLEDSKVLLKSVYKKFISHRIRSTIFATGRRPDGRDTTTVRPITIDQGFLPCAHGSSLFTRGETQALAVATLGGEAMAQRSENLDGENAARFYLQYSFPPSSVGEVGRMGAPGRREIGHGKLAERALLNILPDRDHFPYVVRVESTITESCGSSSMASVCGGCLALMDAGVPITEPVAGIAMGLLIDERKDSFAILTDILGLEDALGDMDFKVAGTGSAVTALQMDIKVEGITIEIMRDALEQARVGRLHILGEMLKVQAEPNSVLPSSLPKVRSFAIPVKRIGDVIGPGGRTIKSIIEQCGGEGNMSISIEDTGTVSVASSDEAMVEKAIAKVKSMVISVDVGSRFEGTVTKTLPFGAYIDIGSGKEGWLHISELEMKRTANVEDVVKVGEQVSVQVIEVGRNGQFRLSRKAALKNVTGKSSSSGDSKLRENAVPGREGK